MNKVSSVALALCASFWAAVTMAQTMAVDPQIRTRTATDGKVMVVEIATHFVTAVRLPEPVNSVVVGDPTLFQVEYNEHEPELVFIKALTRGPAETNLLVSTIHGRQISLLLVSEGTGHSKVDFLVRYKPSGGFLIEQETVPVSLVGESASLSKLQPTQENSRPSAPTFVPASLTSASTPSTAAGSLSDNKPESLDQLLDRQKQAPLPELFGERIEGENTKGDRLRAGISEVIDGGQQVVVLFSVVNTSKHAILLMPPQIQLGGKNKSGKLIKHDRWSTAEQFPVSDFRLSRRRVGPKERADGVVVFERPPYKQSNETLFLQMAESGAVDRPALAPIGFGVSTMREDAIHGTHGKGQ
jgi:hypothetical protein